MDVTPVHAASEAPERSDAAAVAASLASPAAFAGGTADIESGIVDSIEARP
jgi:hypothetical protein